MCPCPLLFLCQINKCAKSVTNKLIHKDKLMKKLRKEHFFFLYLFLF